MKARLFAIALCVVFFSLSSVPAFETQETTQYWAQVNLNSTAASFPYYDDFESGVLGSGWTISTTQQGRVQISSSYPYTGT